MFVATIKSKQQGRVYETHLIRRTYREDGKVKNETVANITALPPETREVIRRSLRGEHLFPADDLEILASRGHGHVALVRGVLRDCGLLHCLHSQNLRYRQVAEAMIVARILKPQSKLATTRWWLTTTLAEEIGIEDATEDELYDTLDWLAGQQSRIEDRLAKRYLRDGAIVLYDVSSSYVTGQNCPLAALGYSRDKKKGTLQIVYGVICDKEGCPIAVEVFEGNTSDTSTVMDQVRKIQNRFGIQRLIFVGDRGMLKQTRITELRQMEGVNWITALDAKQIQKLRASGDLQLGLFDQRNLGEITSELFPDERLVVCKNPLLAAERKRKRLELLESTEERLQAIALAVAAGRLKSAGAIGERVGRAWGRQKMRKHFKVTIAEGLFEYERDTASIEKEAALDGLYVLRTSLLDKSAHPPDSVVRDYKRLSWVERVFRVMKTTQLLVRPIYHYTEKRVRAHVFLCLLGAHVIWHLERRLESLLFHEEDRDLHKLQADPVVSLPRSQAARRKDRQQTSDDDFPLHSLTTLLAEMGTLQRHTLRITGTEGSWDQLTVPSQHQRRAFELAGVRLA